MEERVFTYKLSMHRKEYFLLPRDYQGKRGPLTKVIPLKLFLDRISTSSENDTRALRGCFRGGFVVTLCFKAKENLQCCWDAFFYRNIKQAKEILP